MIGWQRLGPKPWCTQGVNRCKKTGSDLVMAETVCKSEVVVVLLLPVCAPFTVLSCLSRPQSLANALKRTVLLGVQYIAMLVRHTFCLFVFEDVIYSSSDRKKRLSLTYHLCCSVMKKRRRHGWE